MNTARDAVIAVILVLAFVFGGLWLIEQIKGTTVTINDTPQHVEFHVPTPTPTACIILNGQKVCGPKGG